MKKFSDAPSSEYHKINSIFKRDATRKRGPLVIGAWAEPEFEYLQNNQWEWTEKIDGTNIRVIFDGMAGVVALPLPLQLTLQSFTLAIYYWGDIPAGIFFDTKTFKQYCED